MGQATLSGGSEMLRQQANNCCAEDDYTTIYAWACSSSWHVSQAGRTPTHVVIMLQRRADLIISTNLAVAQASNPAQVWRTSRLWLQSRHVCRQHSRSSS